MPPSNVLRTARAVCHRWSDRAELRAFQDAQLRRLLVHAYEQVPYYRKLFDRHRLHPRHIRGVLDLELIPVSSKQELRDLPERDVLAAGVEPSRLLTARTSGSSGEPFTVRRTIWEDKVNYLFTLRALHGLGVRPRDRRVRVGLRRRANPADNKIIGRAFRALGFDRTHTVDGLQNPAELAELLRAARADVITGMPGMLCRVADYLMDSGSLDLRPRLLVTGGEVLTPVMRHRLTAAFQAPIRQTYASHEFPLLAWECSETGNLHTADDGVIIEVLRDGRPVGPGERGEVVATNLNAYAMPFIRYRLGDLVVRAEEQCACGRPFSGIGTIQGRMIDYFRLPDGRVLHPYEILASLIAGGAGWIRQYQLLQEQVDRIVLRVLPSQESVTQHVEEVHRSVSGLLGPGVKFEVQIMDDLALESTGKFRPARSLVPAGPAAVPA